MANLRGKTLFITGASRGIGKAIGWRAAVAACSACGDELRPWEVSFPGKWGREALSAALRSARK